MCENCNLHEDNLTNNKQTDPQVDGAFYLFQGHRLRVVNMNQQSDTADLLGG